MEDPWFQGAHPPVLPTPVPLVTELPLTPEEHNYVIEVMETGNISVRETIQTEVHKSSKLNYLWCYEFCRLQNTDRRLHTADQAMVFDRSFLP